MSFKCESCGCLISLTDGKDTILICEECASSNGTVIGSFDNDHLNQLEARYESRKLAVIKSLSIEDLKQNEHVKGLLETLREIERFWDCEPNSSDLADKKITEWGL